MSKQDIILGIQFGGHDTSAALMVGGELIAACEQERYTRDKHSRLFPNDAIADCLKIAGLAIDDVSEVALTDDHVHYVRETYLRPALHDVERIPFLINDIDRIREALFMKDRVRKETGFSGAIVSHRHHLCHLASSYYASGYDQALLASYDGVGEVDTGMMGLARHGEIKIVNNENLYPDSLGLLYSAVTHYLGWKHHCDEGIVMGLASYGDPSQTIPGQNRSYRSVFQEIVQETGSFAYRIDRSWIAYHKVRDKWVSDRFLECFGPRRTADQTVTEHHRHLAAALQERLEQVVLSQLKQARKEFGLPRLCLAGGVALNCSMNGKIERSGIFDEIFVQPASGDAGLAIGACYLSQARRSVGLMPRKNHNFYLGSRFSDDQVEAALKRAGVIYERARDIHALTAKRLAEGKIVGWFNGAAEFGPRALGNRSILTRPYPAEMKDYLNVRVKFREPFRPYAPAVLAEHAREYFQIHQDSPHMLIAADVVPEKWEEIPAVVHVDGTCRVQTVKAEHNPSFRQLLEAFFGLTGCPVLLNTSFNVKGQPIVNTPEQAIECFTRTNIDVLVLGEFFTEKEHAT